MHRLFWVFLFPYMLFSQEMLTESVVVYNEAIELSGTLKLPSENKAQTLVIFIHGSGPIDRNGNAPKSPMKPNYIQQLGDTLQTRGIAFFSFDKRTANPKNIPYLATTRFQDFGADVALLINYFKQDGRFKKLFLIGHSQGSLIAIQQKSPFITGIISLAGGGTSVDNVLIRQLEAQNPAFGPIVKAHITELMETDTILKVNPFLTGLFGAGQQQFLKSWIQVDPIIEIKNQTKPILILQGDEDLQVSSADAKALASANKNSELVLIPKMNHVLKTVENARENQQSYYDFNFPLSAKLITKILTFITQHNE